MKKIDLTGHAILDRVSRFNTPSKDYLEFFNNKTPPTEPQDFIIWLKEYMSECRNCFLHSSRNKVALSEGSYGAKIMVLFDGPGFLEDLAGIAAVGPTELAESHCGKCRKITHCYRSKIQPDPFKVPRFRKEIIKCDPQYIEKPDIPQFFLNSGGSIIDGILVHHLNGEFPRQTWLDKEGINEPSLWYFLNSVMCRSFDQDQNKDIESPKSAKEACKPWFLYQWAAIQPEVILCFGRSAAGFLTSDTAAKTYTPNQLVETKYGPMVFNFSPDDYMKERNKNVRFP
jgi:uracil-DNA glycosylase